MRVKARRVDDLSRRGPLWALLISFLQSLRNLPSSCWSVHLGDGMVCVPAQIDYCGVKLSRLHKGEGILEATSHRYLVVLTNHSLSTAHYLECSNETFLSSGILQSDSV